METIQQKPVAFTVCLDTQIKDEIAHGKTMERLPNFLKKKMMDHYKKKSASRSRSIKKETELK